MSPSPSGKNSSGERKSRGTDAENFRKLHIALEKLKVGVWTQHSNIVGLSEAWYRFFEIMYGDIFLLEDYVRLIDDPKDRKRVWGFRDIFHQNPPGTLWEDTFSLAGKRVHSRAFITEDGTLFGVDILE